MADGGTRVRAAAEFTVRLGGKPRRTTPGVVFDCPENELPALLASGDVVRTQEQPTPLDTWPEPPDHALATSVTARGRTLVDRAGPAAGEAA